MRKVLNALLLIFIVLALLEGLLRLYGFFYIARLGSLYKKRDTKNKINILAVGESTTGGLWIEDKSYPLQLKKKLNDFYHCNDCVNVSILALAGANTSSTLYYYPAELLKVKPDIVLFMVGINDTYYYAYNFDSLLLESQFFKNKIIYKITLALIRLSNNIKLLRVIKLAYTNLSLSKNVIEDVTYIYQGGDKSKKREIFGKANYSINLEITKSNIEKMLYITKKAKITPILMTYHSASINETIRQIARKNSTPLIDNEKVFPENNFSDYVMPQDGWHPNEKGYQLISENIFLFLIKQKLLKNEIVSIK
jgi:lysophospholipase L1-like esterase